MKSFIIHQSVVVKSIHGNAQVNINGHLKSVALMQALPAGCELFMDDSGMVTLQDYTGQQYTIKAETVTSTTSNVLPNDIAEIQSLIASGEDPTKHTQAPAAGNVANGGGFGFVDLVRSGEEVLATSGYDSNISRDSSLSEHDEDHFIFSEQNHINHRPDTVTDTYHIKEDELVHLDITDNDTDYDGDHVTVSQIDGHTVTPGVEQTIKVNHGHITITADGDMSFVPNKDFTGTVEIPYTVTDGQGGSATSTATITVTPVNDAPVANPETATTSEDKTIKVDFAGNDSDVDGDHVTVSQIDGHTVTPGVEQTIKVNHGHITIAANGDMSFVPNKDFTGTVEIPYTVTDGQGGSATSTATITVTPVNDAPVANPETATTSEDKTIKVDFAGNDSDVDGDHVTVSQIDGHTVTPGVEQTIKVNHGHITIAADGDMSFVPNKDFTGTVEIPYTVTDGQGGSATSTATITVTPVNDAPVANPETATTSEDKTIKVDFAGNDSDVDGDHVTVSQIDGHTVTPNTAQTIKVNHGHITIAADGDMSFVPNKDFTGTVEIPYTVTDGQGGSATSTATITVTPVNDAPVANPETATTSEDKTIKVDFAGNDSDVDGDHVTVSQIDGHTVTPGVEQTIKVNHGHITIAADGDMSFVPNKDFTGTVEIPYTVTDGQGGSASSTATITVTPVNDAPVANPETETTPEDKTIKVDFTGNDSDVDGDHVTVSEINGHTVTPNTAQTIEVKHGHITITADGDMSFVPNKDFTGTVEIPYTVTDGQGGSASSTATITVTPVNDAPVANPETETTPEDKTIKVDFTGNDSDVDGDHVTVSEINGHTVTPNTAQTIEVKYGHIIITADGDMSFVPNKDFTGTVEIPYTVTDGQGGSASSTATITVTPVNDAPVANPDTATTSEDKTIKVDFTGNDSDVDGDHVTVSEINGHTVTPNTAQTIEVKYGHITITADGEMSFVPNKDFTGTVDIPYTVTDGQGGSASSTATITVTPVNDTPVANPETETTPEDKTIKVDFAGNDSDVDGDHVTVSEINGHTVTPNTAQTIEVKHGHITITADGDMTFVPNKDFTGTVEIPYTVTDGQGGSATSTATITVTPVNDAPVANPETETTPEDKTIKVDFAGNDSDVDGDHVTVSQIDGHTVTPNTAQTIEVKHGHITIAADGEMSFVPNKDFTGTVEIPYTVTDGQGGSASSTATITVTPVNDVPVANPDTAMTSEDKTIKVDFSDNDSDVDGDHVTVSQIDGHTVTPGVEQTIKVKHGHITIAADGDMSFVPNKDFTGTVDIPYTVTDGQGGSASSTATITVTPVNDAPVANPETETTPEDKTIKVDFTGNDSDVDGDHVTVSQIDGHTVTPNTAQTIEVKHGHITIAADGEMSFVPNKDFTGTVEIPYTVTDGQGGSASSTATITVTPVNDAPVANPETETTPEDKTIKVDFAGNDSDVDGDHVTVSQIDGHTVTPNTAQTIEVKHGHITIAADGEMSFVPNKDFTGTVEIPYTVTDGQGGSATSTATITVTPVNDAPVANPETETTPEDKTIKVDFAGNDSDVDGDHVTVSQIDGHTVTPGVEQTIEVKHGHITITADGEMSFVPNKDFTGTVEIPYTVTDGQGGSASSTATITVTPVNDVPVANPETETTPEDKTIKVDFTGNDSDVDGDHVTVSQIDGHTVTPGVEQTIKVNHGHITIAADGEMSFVPNKDFTGTVEIPYTVTDGQGGSATSTATITVTPVNDVPVANPETETTPEDKTIKVDFAGNDSDVDGDHVTVSEINGHTVTPNTAQTIEVNHGHITITADGDMTFVPNKDFTGTVEIPYTVTDGQGGSASSTATITVTPVNDAPVANPDTATTSEDKTIKVDFAGNDSDVDGDHVTVSEINGHTVTPGVEQTIKVNHGHITITADGEMSFVPNKDFTGTVEIPYTVTDGQGGSASSTATITVTPVNDVPVANPDTATISEDKIIKVDFTGNDSDVDGDHVTVSEINGHTVTPGVEQTIKVNHGHITIAADGEMSFVPNKDFTGTVEIPYTVTDGQGGSATSTATITVTPVNDAPVANPDTATTSEDKTIKVDFAGNDSDVDGDHVTVSQIDGHTVTPGVEQTIEVKHGHITITVDGEMSFVPNKDFTGQVEIPYTVTDGQGGSASSTATIMVTPVNDAPVANPETETTPEDKTIKVDFTGNDSDVDGDHVTVSQIDGHTVTPNTAQTIEVKHGHITITADGEMSFVPNKDFTGTVEIPYTVTDGQGGSASSTATITVTPVNDAPVANPDTATTSEDKTIKVDFTGNDSDVDGDHVTVSQIDGHTVTPGVEQTIKVNHGHITITADGEMSFVPNKDFTGTVEIPYTVTDGQGGSASSTATITVTPVNDAPVANPETETTPEDKTIKVDFAGNDSDVDGDHVTVSQIDGHTVTPNTAQTIEVKHGHITIAADGEMSFVPNKDFTGTVEIPYTVTDGQGGSATSTATITVTPVNDAPVANPDTATTSEDKTIKVDFTGNDSDVDGDHVTVSQIDGHTVTPNTAQTIEVKHGHITIAADGEMTFVPNKDFTGTVEIPYTVTDGQGGSASSTATITVTPVNDAPVANPETATTSEDKTIKVDFAGNDSDVDGDHVTVSQIDGHTVTPGVEQTIKVNHGHITITADGDMTFVPNKDFTGTVEIPYTVTDGQGGSATSTATITVTPVNDVPVANPETETTPEDKTIKVDFAGNDSDVDGDHVTVSEINGHTVTPNTAQTIEVKHGHITITADGDMTFVPNKDFTGTVEIPYTVTDGQGGSATSTATITVTPVNDTPVANPETETTPEDKTIKVDFAGNDSDVDGDHVTVSEINGHTVTPNTAQTIEVKHGHITITADGDMTFVPNKDFTGTVEIPYTVTDGQGGSATSTATITVTPVNDVPVANPETETTPEDKTIKVDFAGNDSDVDGDHVTVSEINGHTVTPNTAQTIEVKHGHITITADGDMTFVPNKDFTGTVEIPYTVTDGQGGSATSTATITVTPVNDTPVANPETETTPEDKTIKVDFAGNDSDVDGDHVTVSEINGHTVTPNTAQTIEVKHGHITITADGDMTFVPNKDFTGTVEIPYTVTDGQGGSATSTATITVTPVNDAPVANPETETTPEDKTIKVDFAGNDSDVDGDHVTVSQIDGHTVTPNTAQTIEVKHGHITIAADGDMTFVPNKDFTGTVEIPYTVTDGQGGSASSTVTITVTPVNDAPVANPETETTPEDKTIKVDFTGNDSDVDGDHVTVSEINGHTVTPGVEQTIKVKHGHITIAADGDMSFVPNKDFTGTVDIPYTVTDGQGGSASSTATITVTPVNDAPVANPETETTPEDKTIKVDFTGNDSDVDGDHVTVSQIDGHTVTPNTAQTIEVKHGHITIAADGEMSFVPNKDFTGTVEIPYTVTDGQGGSATSTATITVTPVNDAPVANPDTATTSEDKTIKVDFAGNDSDVDGDHVTVSQIDGHTVTPGVEQTIEVKHGHITITVDGEMSFVPNKDFTGQVEIPYTVTDGQGGSASSTATIMVTPVNDAPVANPETETTPEDKTIKVDFTGNDSDVDGDHVTVSQIDGHTVTPNTAQTIEVKHGHITITADGEMSFVPNKDFTGTVEIPYTVTDGQGGSASSTATITVTPVNDAPVANPDTATTSEDKTIKVDFTGNDSDVDGDHVTVSQIDGHTVTPGVEQTIKVNHGHITITADGEMSFVPNKDFTGTVEIPYTVTDGQGGSASSTATITVTPVNDAPVANPETETTPEDKTIKVDFAGNDSDVDGDHVTVSQIDGHTVTPNTAQTIEVKHGHITIAADGEMSFVPNKDFTGTVEIPYTVTDGQGGSATSTATITVTPVNDAPVANPDTATTSEDKTIKVDFTGNDSDVDGDHVTVSQIDGHTVTPNTAQTIEVKHGHITIAADGDMTFVPNKDFTGTVEIPYTVTDGQGGSASSTATITVTPVNDAPVANPETATTSEDKTIKVDFAGNDSDVDGDHVTVSQIDGHTVTPGVEQTIKVNHGHITITADGDMTFVPNKDFTGTVEIPYTVTDGQGGSATSTATITVTPVNDVPVANPETETTPEDKTIKVDFAGNDSDVDGDHVTVSEINGHTVTPNTAQTIEVKHGHITITADGDMTFVPNKDFTGTVEIPYTVTDGQGGSATSTATITVTPVNDTPVANPETETTPEDKTIKVDFAGNDSDVDGDHVTVSEINGHTVTPNTAQTIEVKHGHITITADGDMTFVPNKDFTGTVEIPYTVTDGQGGSATSTATITVTPVNDAPVANPETETTPEDKTIKVDFAGNDSDVDGDHVTVSQIDGHTVTPNTAQTIEVKHGHITIAADGDMTFVPNKDFTGTVEIPYTVTDGQGGSASSTVTITVTPVNDAPVANPETETTPEDKTIKVDFTGNDSDVDGDHVTVSEINGHTVTPGVEQTIKVKHGHITIAADGDMSFVPNKDFTGTVDIPYTVTDGQGGSASSTATITVTPVNDAPVANPETETTPEDKTIKVDFTGNDSDVDGDHVTVSQIDGHTVTPNTAQTIEVKHGHITIAADGEMSFVPNKDFTGTVEIPYTVTDGQGGSASSTATITVTPVNDVPVANPDTATTSEDKTIKVDFAGNDSDVDGDHVTVSQIDGHTVTPGVEQTIEVNNGHITITVDGEMTFVPNKDFTGTVEIPYTVTDGQGGSASSTATITVTPVNDAPVANPDTATTSEDKTIKVDFTGNDSDVDGDHVTVSEINGHTVTPNTAQTIEVKHGHITIAADGEMSFVPNKDFTGTVEIPYTVTDGQGGGASSTATITVTPVNDAPVAHNIEITTNEDTPYSLNWASFNIQDTDSNQDQLSIRLTQLPKDGVVQIFTSGQWQNVDSSTVISKAEFDAKQVRFVPELNESSDNSSQQDIGNNAHTYADFTYVVIDGTVQSLPHDVTVKVNAIADPVVVNLTIGEGVYNSDVYKNGHNYTSWKDIVNSHQSDQILTLTPYGDNENLDSDNTHTVVRGLAGADLISAWGDNKDVILIGDDGDLSNNTIGAGSPLQGQLNDTLYGGVGNDILVGESGDDTLYGNKGTDTAVYARNFADYVISQPTITADGGHDLRYHVTDKLTLDEHGNYSNAKAYNGEGRDDLYNIERLQFADGTYYWNGDEWIKEQPTVTYPLDINANLTDTDGSEFISKITLSGLPQGAVLSDENGLVIGTANNNGLITLTGLWKESETSVHIKGLKLQVPAQNTHDVTVKVEAISEEHSNHSTNIGSDDTILDPSNYGYQNISYGDNVVQGNNGNDIIIGDTTGIQITQGENYNIAFILDRSSSMNQGCSILTDSDNVMKALSQVDKVLLTLKSTLDIQGSGHINVALTMFATNAKLKNIDLASYQAGDLVKEYNSKSGWNSGWSETSEGLKDFGVDTNYDAAFTKTSDWFKSNEVLNNNGHNRTYFFTDGVPNYILDQNGNSVSGDSVQLKNKSLNAFHKLVEVSPTVDAIGLLNQVNDAMLKPYDTDGLVHTQIKAEEISDLVLGKETKLTQGADIVSGGEGNDILFGDIIKLDEHSELQGFNALKQYAESQENASHHLTTYDVFKYIQHHIEQFDVSHAGDANDTLNGDQGNDILFGQGGNDILSGGQGNDILLGGFGDDKLHGNTGNDLLIGGSGNDILIGGDGFDTFAWHQSHQASTKDEIDHIKDFNWQEDKLNLSDLLHNISSEQIDDYLTIKQDGKDTVISVANNDHNLDIVLDNVNVHDIKSHLGIITNNLLKADGEHLILNSHVAEQTAVYEPMVTSHHIIDEHNI